jgi:hypothetical protein
MLGISGISGVVTSTTKAYKGVLWRYLTRRLKTGSQSAWSLWTLSRLFSEMIPFNRFHRISVKTLTLSQSEVSLPFIKANHNHLGELHACALTTAGEFCSGILLLRNFSPAEYRLIMKGFSVEYHRRGRSSAVARCEISEPRVEEIRDALTREGSLFVPMSVDLFDIDGAVLCTLQVKWQLKPWDSVARL